MSKVKEKSLIRKKVKRFLSDQSLVFDNPQVIQEVLESLEFLAPKKSDDFSESPRILVASIIPDDTVGVKGFLNSLMKIDYPKDRIDYCLFFSDNNSAVAKTILDFAEKALWRGRLILPRQNNIDFSQFADYRKNKKLYNELVNIKVKLKNRLLDEVIYGRFDYMLYLEPGQIVQSGIVKKLISVDADFAAGIVDNYAHFFPSDESENIKAYIGNYCFEPDFKDVVFEDSYKMISKVRAVYGAYLVKSRIFEDGILYEFHENGEDYPFFQKIMQSGYNIKLINEPIGKSFGDPTDIINVNKSILDIMQQIKDVNAKLEKVINIAKGQTVLYEAEKESVLEVLNTYQILYDKYINFYNNLKDGTLGVFNNDLEAINEQMIDISKKAKAIGNILVINV